MRGCARQGLGDPPLCQTHVQQFYPAGEDDAGADDPVDLVLERLMQEPRVQEVFSQVAGRVDAFAGFLGRLGEKTFSARTRAPRGGQSAPPPGWGRREEQAPPKAKYSDGDAARKIMGFKPGQALTADQVKKRYRELAKKHHPDRGGDLAKMVAINRANDALMKEFGG